MAKKNELAVLDTFKLTNPYEGMDPELLAELEDELADLDEENGITCRRIKMPSGGALAFEVQGEDEEDVEYVKELQGVILFTHRVNGYWSKALGDGDGGAAPDCSSMDGKIGINVTTGECITCDTCPLNQYGSDAGGGAGKACKNMRRLYLMVSGDPNCYLLTVPPTSIKDVNKKLRALLTGGTPYIGMVVSIKLTKETNKNGVDYAKIVLNKAGLLPPDVVTQAKELRRQMKGKFMEMSINAAEYNTPRQDPADIFVDDDDLFPARDEQAPPPSDLAPQFEEAPPLPNDDNLPFA
ncbi:MAG: hypothetical protein K2M42_05815 [Oscillospiraceae bacterium]|nr:hypothetical protein [Oscillospiraceae bacterium]